MAPPCSPVGARMRDLSRKDRGDPYLAFAALLAATPARSILPAKTH